MVKYYPVKIKEESAYFGSTRVYTQFLNYYDFTVDLYTEDKEDGELKQQVNIYTSIEDEEFAKVVVASVVSSYKGYLSYEEAYEIGRMGLERGRLPDYWGKEYRVECYNSNYSHNKHQKYKLAVFLIEQQAN